MSKLRFQITMTLDGYVAGPNQSVEHPIGEGTEHLHDWVYKLKTFREMHGDQGGETDLPLLLTPRAGAAAEHVPAHDCRAEVCEGLPEHIIIGVTTLPSTHQSSYSPTTDVSHWSCREGRRSPSSPTA